MCFIGSLHTELLFGAECEDDISDDPVPHVTPVASGFHSADD